MIERSVITEFIIFIITIITVIITIIINTPKRHSQDGDFRLKCRGGQLAELS